MLLSRKIGALTCMASLALATSAHAAVVVYNGTTYDAVISDPTPVGSGAEQLVGFTLSIVNTTGNAALNPNTFLGNSSGFIGIGGDLHHEQFKQGFPIATQQPSPTAASAAGSTVDSHFLIVPDLILSPQIEPLVDGLTSSEPGDFGPNPNVVTGFGAPLTGDFGISGQSVPSSMDLAYLVVPLTGQVNLFFQVSNSLGQSQNIQTSFNVPEPASAVLVLGGMALMFRRRRRPA